MSTDHISHLGIIHIINAKTIDLLIVSQSVYAYCKTKKGLQHC